MSVIIKNILLLLLCIYFLESCKDSLGIDPKFQKFPVIVEDTIIGDSSANQIKIKYVALTFSDSSLISSNLKVYPWEGNNILKSYDIRIDTSGTKIKLWMSYDAQNPASTSQLKERKDRSTASQLILKTFLPHSSDTTLSLDGLSDSGKWFTVEMQWIDSTTHFFNFSGRQVKSSIKFLAFNRTTGTLYGNITVDLNENKHTSLQTKKFNVTFVLKF